jgi:hypothetical protein
MLRLLVQGAKQSNRLWRLETADDGETARSRCLRLLKAARQVELLHTFPEHARLVVDPSCEAELTYGVRLAEPMTIINLKGCAEQVRDAEHIPHRIAAAWMCPEEIVERLGNADVRTKRGAR